MGVERQQSSPKILTKETHKSPGKILAGDASAPRHVTPRIRCARCPSVIFRCCHFIFLHFAFYHVIMCISFCIRVRFMHPSIFPVVRFAIRHSYALRRPPFCLSLCAGVKLSRNGPRFAKWPWYSTGRPPVKFRAICRSFDTPTVNRVTVKLLSLCSPTPLSKWPKIHPNPLHALGRLITIAWPQTAPHLESPSSSYLYK